MSDIEGYWLLLIVGILLIPIAFLIDHVNSQSTKYQEHPELAKKPLHKRWWIYLIAVFLVVGSIGNLTDPSTYKQKSNHTSTKEMRKAYKEELRESEKVHSSNLPGQRINSDLATKHEFYWTDKKNNKIRYFVDADKKITAIKYVSGSDQIDTIMCQSLISKILQDNDIKYGNDKESADDALLDNGGMYNLYSPNHKKWYRVNFSKGFDKDTVGSFSIYPGKSDEAE